MAIAPAGPRRRRYPVIADHLETMLQDARARSPHGFGLPRHVEDSFRRLLDCGIMERGFARVVCPSCQYEILVPFSCKVRGICPSCDGRRMAAGAADLVDHILPVGSFANANLHFHTLVPEGVWHEQPDGSLGFHPLPPPTDEDVEEIAARIVGKVRHLLARRDGEAVDDEPDALAYAQAEAVQLPMSLAEPAPPTRASRRRCAFIDGFSLHADTSVDAADRSALERLVRYVLRPLISADRLTARPDGRVEYHFRRPDPSGRTSWVTDGPTWCRRLATLIPPRRSHTTRFHGVFSSAHAWRSRVVASLPTAAERASTITPPTSMRLARRLDWAALLRRVFGDEVTQCPRCGDALRVLAFITDPRVTAHILDHLGLSSDAVPISSARAPPDDPVSDLDFGA